MNQHLEDIFFNPAGIAVIGASKNPAKLGYALARNLIESGYAGEISLVNPQGGVLFNRKVYQNIADIPDTVEMAILIIPAQFIPQALRECGERGIKGAVIASGGFREIGPTGARLETECIEIAKTYQMRLIGPNCVGIIDTHIPLNATFLSPPGPQQGDLALLSQSGAICAAVIDWARSQDLGFSRMISLGNQADINETDLLIPTANDPNTKVITLYLEGIGNGYQFIRTAPEVTRRKPVVALKVGRSASGERAAASHTGSLAGQDTAFEAVFRRCGVIRAQTSEELFDWARALAWCPLPEGPATAILTNSGGPGVTAADTLETYGLYLTGLSPATLEELRSFLPSVASVNNPIDLLASATPSQYANSLQLLIADKNVHNILVILVPPPLFDALAMINPLIPIIRNSPKPVVMVLMGGDHIQKAVQELRNVRIPEYRFPERAAAALGALVKRMEFLKYINDKTITFNDVDPARVERILASFQPEFETNWLPPEPAAEILEAYGIHTPPQAFAESLESALIISRKFGIGQSDIKLAIKVISSDIPHKSDHGGVILNINSEEELIKGYSRIIQNVTTSYPFARIQGVLLQLMVSQGQEVILGAVQDDQFGPLVMFGSGGVEVEGLHDIAFGLAPLTLHEVETMLESTWAGKKLQGYRSIKEVDRECVKEILLRLAQLAEDFPQLVEIEINPLFVMQSGAYALDVRMRMSHPEKIII